MKFTCEKSNLQNVLNFATNIVNPKSTLSILSNVLIENEGKSALYVTATDLEIGAKCKIAAQIATPGAVTLPAKKLFDVIRDFPVRDITIDVSEKHIASIASSNSLAKIVGLPQDEFPKFPKVKTDKAVTMEQTLLKQMLQKTSYSISDDSTRYVLTGLFMVFKDSLLTMVATDGKRLAIIQQGVTIPKDYKESIIVPAKTINELIRILKEEGEVTIAMIGNQVAFTLDNVVIVSRLIEGHFPDYEQVIPSKTEEKISLNREEFQGAISRAAIFTDKKSNSVKLKFGENKLVVSANITEVGESKEEIDIAYKGKKVAIAFNPQYVIDVLKVLEQEEVILELTDEESPGVIRTEEQFTYVIMPMRVS